MNYPIAIPILFIAFVFLAFLCALIWHIKTAENKDLSDENSQLNAENNYLKGLLSTTHDNLVTLHKQTQTLKGSPTNGQFD